MLRPSAVLLPVAFIIGLASTAQAQTIRVGYWSSGVSLGFGAMLQAGEFFEDQGFDVEFFTFPDVNTPTRVMAADGIDFAIGASAGSAFSVTSSGLPVSIILATQVADLKFVVPADSEIQSIADLSGRKIGTSPAGSATAAITAAILDGNYDIAPSEYEAVPGNDSRLAQFLAQGDIDAAALRTVSLALLPDAQLREIGSFREEWAALTGQDAVPVLGVGLIRNAWMEENPDAAPRVVAAMRAAYEYGRNNKDEVAQAMEEIASIAPEDAAAYAALWDDIYTVTMEPEDVESLRAEFEVFKSVGAVEGEFNAGAINPEPYEASKALQ